MAMHDITEYTQKLADTFTKQSNIATVESTSTASKAYAVDEFLIYGGQFYKVTSAIAQGDTIVTTGASANVEATTVTDEMGTGGGPTSGVLLADGSVPADNLTIGSRVEGSNVGIRSFTQGRELEATNENAHAEGMRTKAKGSNSHAEGSGPETGSMGGGAHAEGFSATAVNTTAGEESGIYAGWQGSHAEGLAPVYGFIHATGGGSHAEGYAYGGSESAHKGILSSGGGSHAEGLGGITASGEGSHAEGNSVAPAAYDSTTGTRTGIMASGKGAHAEGYVGNATAFIHSAGVGSHAEGAANVPGTGVYAGGAGAHAEGQNTTASYSSSHAEGSNTTANGSSSHAEGLYTTAHGSSSHTEGKSTAPGSESVGIYTSGDGAHAEGCVDVATSFIRATGKGAHAEGYSATAGAGILASGYGSHAEGVNTTASGNYSHAEGEKTTASSQASHAEGCETTAGGFYSHAEGYNTTANNHNHAQGYYNKEMNAGVLGSTVGDAMAIGNGTNASTLSNCFRVTYAGAVYGLSAFNSSGADYAEFFEWKDGNVENEDRVGIFVTLDGDKIKPANSGDYILGIISGQPSVVGNGDEDWLGRWQRDDFGRFVWGDVEVKNPETKKMETVNTMLANPDYDNTQTYVERKDRKEWDYVGMLGTLAVRDNGKCEVNGYCACGENGIAVPAENGYRVIKRVSENVIKVIVK